MKPVQFECAESDDLSTVMTLPKGFQSLQLSYLYLLV